MARQAGDENLQIRFFTNRELSEYQTAQQGKDVYVEIENIQIFVPGMRDTVNRQVTDEDKVRFGDEYKAWKKEQDAPVDGLPLDQWPGASVDLIEALRNVGVRSVEQLVAVDDAYIAAIPGAATAKTRAQAQSEAVAAVASITAMKVENEKLKADVEVLTKRSTDLEATLAARDATILDLENKLTAPKK